jgi:hypothetical protein
LWAIGALEHLAALGVAVPAEISVIGCDDIFAVVAAEVRDRRERVWLLVNPFFRVT